MPTSHATPELPDELRKLTDDPRVTVRRSGVPDPKGKCVVYWMQRAQRGIDNHAVNLAVEMANHLGLPLVVYFAGISNFPHANLRHYAFLNQGLPDIESDLADRNITFILRNAPHESHERLFADVHAAIVIGDENPMREPERWRQHLAAQLRIPFWTVDTDVLVPSKLIEKAQYGAYTIRPRLYKMLPQFLQPYENPHANYAWKRPANFHADSVHEDMTRHWKDLDRSVAPVEYWKGGTHAAQTRLKLFTTKLLRDYEVQRNKPESDGTSCMSPYLHYGHIGPQTIALAVDAAAQAEPSLQLGPRQLLQRADRVARTLRQLRPLHAELRFAGLCRVLGEEDYRRARPRRARTPLHPRAARHRPDLRRSLERRADPDGSPRLDAQLSAHVLGQEDP